MNHSHHCQHLLLVDWLRAGIANDLSGQRNVTIIAKVRDSRKDRAKDLATLQEMINAASAFRWRGKALALARCRKKSRVSSDHRPPTSHVRTTRRDLLNWPDNSGHRLSLRALAVSNEAKKGEKRGERKREGAKRGIHCARSAGISQPSSDCINIPVICVPSLCSQLA